MLVDLAGSYSKQADLLNYLTGLQIEASQDQRRHDRKDEQPNPRQRKYLDAEEVGQMVGKYEAGASLTQLKAEHHMAKANVAKVLQQAGLAIRPVADGNVAIFEQCLIQIRILIPERNSA
ncbi:hypothetical protein [Nocardia asteroides]|uniref:hypothetical protein n=1 Tax=Nocardia asteroides TaxID=1824 RepID=UPI001E55F0C4|nr:hypothetical protein [Nocardia asteroides]UGT63986.1 hypothetical protein LTT61_12050 [Nocardia asteroides]